MAEEDKNKIHCNQCRHITNHVLLFEDKTIEFQMISVDDVFFENPLGDYKIWKMLKCAGCEDVSLQEIYKSGLSDELDYAKFYPPRIARKKPDWFFKILEEYQGLLNEIYAALYSGSRRLALMGVRSLIDTFISRKVGDQGNFKSGMQKLLEEGFISKRNKKTLESVIEMGHATIHREFAPTSKQVNAVMDIVENLLQHDVLQDSATTLKSVTPKRVAAKK